MDGGGGAMTPVQQIAGYLKLTSAHYYLNSRHDENLQLKLRFQISKEMSVETLLMAIAISDHTEFAFGEVMPKSALQAHEEGKAKQEAV